MTDKMQLQRLEGPLSHQGAFSPRKEKKQTWEPKFEYEDTNINSTTSTPKNTEENKFTSAPKSASFSAPSASQWPSEKPRFLVNAHAMFSLGRDRTLSLSGNTVHTEAMETTNSNDTSMIADNSLSNSDSPKRKARPFEKKQQQKWQKKAEVDTLEEKLVEEWNELEKEIDIVRKKVRKFHEKAQWTRQHSATDRPNVPFHKTGMPDEMPNKATPLVGTIGDIPTVNVAAQLTKLERPIATKPNSAAVKDLLN